MANGRSEQAMTLSVLDLFTIGVGPSSSHTVGPMRAARNVAGAWLTAGLPRGDKRVRVELYGSLGATGPGHGTPAAIVAGLRGAAPETVDPEQLPRWMTDVSATGQLPLLDADPVRFTPEQDILARGAERLPVHPNGMRFLLLVDGKPWDEQIRYSVGGGTVVDAAGRPLLRREHGPIPHPYRSADSLLATCREAGMSVWELTMANEGAFRPRTDTEAALDEVASAMRLSIERGCRTDGTLPGALGVPRRAARLRRQLESRSGEDGLHELDWISTFAIAVNEENAAGARVVTAPTNGAAGIVPAVLEHCRRRGADAQAMRRFLLTAGAIGILYKETASVSGAEVGCQGEVGSACSMAAAGLAEILGGTTEQIENAAEIAMEHNLGLTCDPVGGLVQVPCIERNALGAVKAVTAARMALQGDGSHIVSLDQVIRTMRDIGADMHVKYKETSLGGLAVNVIDC
jgi:L-serine dehydratase